MASLCFSRRELSLCSFWGKVPQFQSFSPLFKKSFSFTQIWSRKWCTFRCKNPSTFSQYRKFFIHCNNWSFSWIFTKVKRFWKFQNGNFSKSTTSKKVSNIWTAYQQQIVFRQMFRDYSFLQYSKYLWVPQTHDRIEKKSFFKIDWGRKRMSSRSFWKYYCCSRLFNKHEQRWRELIFFRKFWEIRTPTQSKAEVKLHFSSPLHEKKNAAEKKKSCGPVLHSANAWEEKILMI